MTDTADDRLDKLEAQCTDLFRQLRGVREHARQDRLDDMGRFDRMSNRIAKLAEEDANADQELSQRLDRFAIELGGKANGSMVKQLAADVATMIEAVNKRFEKVERFFPGQGGIDHEAGAVIGCECYICQSNRAQLAAQKAPPRKRIGWVNVYPPDTQYTSRAELFSTREQADALSNTKRIACIEVFEGAGLPRAAIRPGHKSWEEHN